MHYRHRLLKEHPTYSRAVFVQDIPAAMATTAGLRTKFESMYDDEVNANKVSEFQKFDEDTFGQFLYLVMMRINKMIVAEYK